MKILLDENLPEALKKEFIDFEIYSVTDMKWNSKKNGELLTLLDDNEFDVLITLDKNLKHQQNLTRFKTKIICLKAIDSKIETLIPFIGQTLEILKSENISKYIEV